MITPIAVAVAVQRHAEQGSDAEVIGQRIEFGVRAHVADVRIPAAEHHTAGNRLRTRRPRKCLHQAVGQCRVVALHGAHVHLVAVIFAHDRRHRVAQFRGAPSDQPEHGPRVIGRGGDRLQHFDAGGLAGDQIADQCLALIRLGDVRHRADQPRDPPAVVSLDRGLIA